MADVLCICSAGRLKLGEDSYLKHGECVLADAKYKTPKCLGLTNKGTPVGRIDKGGAFTRGAPVKVLKKETVSTKKKSK